MELVKLQEVNGKNVVATTSWRIAEVFKKKHFHVVKLIEIEINKGLFNASNFSVSSCLDNSGRTRKMYWIDEIFTYSLIGGFTGTNADQWKIQYVQAFIAMKDKISKKNALHPADVFKDFFRVAELLGLNKKQAAIHANIATKTETGEDVLANMGYKVTTESMTVHLSKALVKKGLITRGSDGVNWALTPKGIEAGGKQVFQEVGGKVKQSIEWASTISELLSTN
jgi:Rha family phage regulatory protein